jgi:hypothetical protein
MSHVMAAPEMVAAAAAPTLAVLPAAADEVSASIAHPFSQHAANYPAVAAQAAGFREQFVQNLTASAGSYAGSEAAPASFRQDLNVNTDSALNLLSHEAAQPVANIIAVDIVAVYVALIATENWGTSYPPGNLLCLCRFIPPFTAWKVDRHVVCDRAGWALGQSRTQRKEMSG